MRETSEKQGGFGCGWGQRAVVIVAVCVAGTGVARADVPALAGAASPRIAEPNPWEAVPPPVVAAPAAAPQVAPAASPVPAAQVPFDPWMNPSPSVAPPPKLIEVTEYYRGQVVLADLAGLLAAGLIGSETNSGWAFLAYLLASPAVHVAHGNSGRAFGSLGLHVLMPVVGALVGVATSTHCSGDTCGIDGNEIAVWVLGGLAAATVLDAVFLANVTKVVEQPQQARLMPVVLPTKSGGATFGLAATF